MHRILVYCLISILAFWLMLLLVTARQERLKNQIQELQYTYQITVQAKLEGKPCAYEVWRTTVTSPTNFASGDDDMVIDEDGWEVIYRQDDCWNISDSYLKELNK